MSDRRFYAYGPVAAIRGGDRRQFVVIDRPFLHRIVRLCWTADEALAEAAMLNLKHRAA